MNPGVIYSKLPGEVELCAYQQKNDMPNLVIQDFLSKVFRDILLSHWLCIKH